MLAECRECGNETDWWFLGDCRECVAAKLNQRDDLQKWARITLDREINGHKAEEEWGGDRPDSDIHDQLTAAVARFSSVSDFEPESLCIMCKKPEDEHHEFVTEAMVSCACDRISWGGGNKPEVCEHFTGTAGKPCDECEHDIMCHPW